ncbi:hypothetical protein GOBAR_DD31515 [Gossypium barbadense]|nr:hypothetical protein GOBAR_DD31515 [Gossypium barbadense]
MKFVIWEEVKTNDVNRKEKRHITSIELDEVIGKVKEVGERLKYKMKKGKRGILRLEKMRMVSIVEVVEIAKLSVLLEVKVVEGMVKFDERQWLDLEGSLGDICFLG